MSARSFGFLAYWLLFLATLSMFAGSNVAVPGIMFSSGMTCLAAREILKALGK